MNGPHEPRQLIRVQGAVGSDPRTQVQSERTDRGDGARNVIGTQAARKEDRALDGTDKPARDVPIVYPASAAKFLDR